MAFIGNTNTTQAFAPAIDYFNGDGTTVAFTLSRPVASVAQVQTVINNVPQNPSSAYTVSGNTITFTSAPSSGTSNIYVYYTSPITQVVQPSTGTVGKTQLDVYGGTGTGAMTVPTGTTAQRPSNPVVGDTRWNTTLGQQEVFVGSSTWQSIASPTYTVFYMLVAGGGGGAGTIGGGGGAGGLLTGNQSATIGTAYTVTIGAGGASASSGSDSVFSLIGTVVGGGRGGAYTAAGASGGSGGGGGGTDSGTSAGGSATSGQGYAGATGVSGRLGGGGGGSAAAGATGTSNTGGRGGNGTLFSVTGSYYGAGGGGGVDSINSSTPGSGGTGGGGNGNTGTGNGFAGSTNTGSGGGGGGNTSGGGNGNGGAGGSGIVIVAYLGSQRGTGGTVTSSGGYTIHTFTSSSTYTA